MKKTHELMTEDPICCLPNDTVTKVSKIMQDNDIGSVPVIDSTRTKKLVGIVTDRDLVLEVMAEERDPQTTKVRDIMTRGVLTCHIDDDLEKTLSAMSGYRLRRIPVVDSEDRIVGIISQADVATRLDMPEKTAAVIKEISQSSVYLLER